MNDTDDKSVNRSCPETYDITDWDSVHDFGITQGEALVANPETQGDPTWPVADGEYADSGFGVGTPPDIMADKYMLNAYLDGVAFGLESVDDDLLRAFGEGLPGDDEDLDDEEDSQEETVIDWQVEVDAMTIDQHQVMRRKLAELARNGEPLPAIGTLEECWLRRYTRV